MGRKYKMWTGIALALLLVLSGCGRSETQESTASPTVPPYLLPSGQASSSSAEETESDGIYLVPNAAAVLSEEELQKKESARERAAAIAAEMTETELICQLMIVYPEAVSPEITAVDAAGNLLQEYPVGGLLLRSQNAESEEQLQTLIRDLQKASAVPLLILAEEEGGRTVTFMKTLEQPTVRNMFSYRGDGLARAFLNAQQLAENLASLGINADLAPVTDVWSDLENRNIGERAYGDSFVKTAELIAEAVKGFHSRKTICTLKYFPGSGEAVPLEKKSPIAVLNKSEAELRRGELIPYAAGIAAGADMVMIGNLQLPQLDPNNLAPFSSKVVTGLLREEMGFDGVIITDLLYPILSEQFLSPELAGLKALMAGCDLVLCPLTDESAFEEYFTVLLAALEAENITRERLEESVIRVLTLKILYGILP
ncbi:MAG: glycoside hydrolase family 3 protein [Lachnospiraceae bacterium]|nr:glycoside hydrolase family 3 protein [Lachnospiraceae bacterium]